jgi:hypothetical protein
MYNGPFQIQWSKNKEVVAFEMYSKLSREHSGKGPSTGPTRFNRADDNNTRIINLQINVELSKAT